MVVSSNRIRSISPLVSALLVSAPTLLLTIPGDGRLDALKVPLFGAGSLFNTASSTFALAGVLASAFLTILIPEALVVDIRKKLGEEGGLLGSIVAVLVVLLCVLAGGANGWGGSGAQDGTQATGDYGWFLIGAGLFTYCLLITLSKLSNEAESLNAWLCTPLITLVVLDHALPWIRDVMPGLTDAAVQSSITVAFWTVTLTSAVLLQWKVERAPRPRGFTIHAQVRAGDWSRVSWLALYSGAMLGGALLVAAIMDKAGLPGLVPGGGYPVVASAFCVGLGSCCLPAALSRRMAGGREVVSANWIGRVAPLAGLLGVLVIIPRLEGAESWVIWLFGPALIGVITAYISISAVQTLVAIREMVGIHARLLDAVVALAFAGTVLSLSVVLEFGHQVEALLVTTVLLSAVALGSLVASTAERSAVERITGTRGGRAACLVAALLLAAGVGAMLQPGIWGGRLDATAMSPDMARGHASELITGFADKIEEAIKNKFDEIGKKVSGDAQVLDEEWNQSAESQSDEKEVPLKLGQSGVWAHSPWSFQKSNVLIRYSLGQLMRLAGGPPNETPELSEPLGDELVEKLVRDAGNELYGEYRDFLTASKKLENQWAEHSRDDSFGSIGWQYAIDGTWRMLRVFPFAHADAYPALESYEEVFSPAVRSLSESGVGWTEPYVDVFGLGAVSTCIAPVTPAHTASDAAAGLPASVVAYVCSDFVLEEFLDEYWTAEWSDDLDLTSLSVIVKDRTGRLYWSNTEESEAARRLDRASVGPGDKVLAEWRDPWLDATNRPKDKGSNTSKDSLHGMSYRSFSPAGDVELAVIVFAQGLGE
jgi:hypothetical protein